jgi:membrane-associated phospholipid phosphatase
VPEFAAPARPVKPLVNKHRAQQGSNPDRGERMKGLRNWSLGFFGTAIAVAASYLWLDRPISLLAHDELQRFHLFEKLSLIPEALTPLAVVACIVALGLRGLSGRPLSRFQSVVLLSGLSLAVAVVAKDQLKFAFGRPWPETWIFNNPSFIRDGAYGFQPFHGGPGYASFPSGHMAMTCSVITVLWICYPAYRPAYAIAMAAVAVGLVGANFHFLSDAIAGGFLGISAGWVGVALWEISVRQVRPEAGAAADPRVGGDDKIEPASSKLKG